MNPMDLETKHAVTGEEEKRLENKMTYCKRRLANIRGLTSVNVKLDEIMKARSLSSGNIRNKMNLLNALCGLDKKSLIPWREERKEVISKIDLAIFFAFEEVVNRKSSIFAPSCEHLRW